MLLAAAWLNDNLEKKRPLLSVHAAPSWRARVRYIVDSALDFFLPPVCASCRRVGPLLCDDCRAALPWVRPPLCDACGRSLPETAATCWLCRQGSSPLVQVRAALDHSGPVPPAIHALKYEGLFAVALPLAELMEAAWPRWRTPIDMVVPVPLHPERERERGFNQACLLSRHLCHKLALPLETAVLRRIRQTRPQVGLSRADRLTNVSGAFRAQVEHVAGRRILLVDDVYTTGATLAAAGSALLDAGARSVSAYCLARPAEN